MRLRIPNALKKKSTPRLLFEQLESHNVIKSLTGA
ncbi:hypothetical protein FBX97_5032 [Herbaspirillum sp. SJZ107]|nr:hypothetical protein FBX97_5032 [Herbaspirillum sp. SJZ107]